MEDIATDDVPQVYEKVPIGAFLNLLGYPNEKFSITNENGDGYSDKNTYGKSVFSRINEVSQEEQGLLALLFSGTRTFLEVEGSLVATLPEGETGSLFMEVVKEISEQKYSMVRFYIIIIGSLCGNILLTCMDPKCTQHQQYGRYYLLNYLCYVCVVLEFTCVIGFCQK